MILEESKLFQVNLQRRQQIHLIDQSVSVDSNEDFYDQEILLAEESLEQAGRKIDLTRNLKRKSDRSELELVETMQTASTCRSSMERPDAAS
jgi:hypothetical protein